MYAPQATVVTAAPVIPASVPLSSDARANVVLDSLKNFHIGAANEIYVLFEHKTRELEKAQQHIEQLNAMHRDVAGLIGERENIIRQLGTELQNTNANNLVVQANQYAEEANRLRSAHADIENARQTQQHHKAATEAEARDRQAALQRAAADLQALKNQLQEAEARLDAYLRSRTDEYGVGLRTLEQEKAHNAQLAVIIGQLDQEAAAINLHVQQIPAVTALIAEREAEILALSTRIQELQALIATEAAKIAPKDAVIVQLRAELAEASEAFNRMRQANNVLLKRAVVLEEDISSGEEAEYDRLTQAHVDSIKGSLSNHIAELKRIFQSVQVKNAPPAGGAAPARPGAASPAPAAAPRR